MVAKLKKYYNKMKYPVLVFVLLSLLTHVVVYTLINIARQKPKPPIAKVVEVEYISPAPSKKKGDKQKNVIKRRKQIVTQEKRINEEKPDDARFLSKFNQRVKKQTRAAKSGAFNNSAKPGQQVAGQDKKPQPKPTPKKNMEKGPGKIKKLSQLVPQYSLTPDARKDLARHVGNPSQTDDYLKDVETGLQTALSTREFLYYSYYDRIKKKIRQFWEPNVRQQVKMIYRKGRTIASSSDRITQVLITLDSQGSLVRIEVITQSGVAALDHAAIEAFKEAAPFPNPPKGMVEQDGRIRIRWDFILEANAVKIMEERQYATLARPEKSL
ncbi:MAG: energy transducer TonB [Pseudomonadota bacterium]